MAAVPISNNNNSNEAPRWVSPLSVARRPQLTIPLNTTTTTSPVRGNGSDRSVAVRRGPAPMVASLVETGEEPKMKKLTAATTTTVARPLLFEK